MEIFWYSTPSKLTYGFKYVKICIEQDAKSDRVKQLLKETEGYLQTLGGKLQQQKMQSRATGNEPSMDIESEIFDEDNDQAQV